LERESNSTDESERLKTPEPVRKHEPMKREDSDWEDKSAKVHMKLKVKKEVKPMDNSDSDDSSESDSQRPLTTPALVTVQRGSSTDNESEKKVTETPANSTKTGSASDDSDSDTPDKDTKKTASEPKPNTDNSSNGDSSGNKAPPEEKAASNETNDINNSENSSDEKQEKAPKAKAAVSDSSCSKTEVKSTASQVKNNKRKNEFGDKSDTKRKRPYGESGFAGQRIKLKGKTRRVFVGNLNYNIDDEKIKEFFKDIGEISDIFWLTDKYTGDFKGAGFVTFETVEAATKAVEEKSGQQLMHRSVKLDWTKERDDGGSTKKSSSTTPDWVNNPLSDRPENCTTVFLGNLDFKITEDDVRNHFKDCGKLKDIRWIEKDGNFKGAGFAEFESVEGADNAVKLCGKEIIGRAARVDYTKSRPPRD